MNDNWSFSQVWNEALNAMPERETEPRDYIWASELGRGFYDRYWKMHGRKPTTPPNLRSRRKFEAGNLTEWVIEQILRRANVLKESQERVYYRDGAMVVSGRLDFVGGGNVQELDESFYEGLPESFVNVAQAAIGRLKETHPNGMQDQIIELKSCAGVMFDRYLVSPNLHHVLQCFHYVLNKETPGVVEYVSRDDLRMVAYPVLPTDPKLKELYDFDIQRMSEVYQMSEDEVAATMKQPLLVWDESRQRFSKNFEVEYSLYLTDYGFDEPMEYADQATKTLSALNRIVKKLREGKPFTKVNEKSLDKASEFFPEAREFITAELEASAKRLQEEADNASEAS